MNYSGTDARSGRHIERMKFLMAVSSPRHVKIKPFTANNVCVSWRCTLCKRRLRSRHVSSDQGFLEIPGSDSQILEPVVNHESVLIN